MCIFLWYNLEKNPENMLQLLLINLVEGQFSPKFHQQLSISIHFTGLISIQFTGQGGESINIQANISTNNIY